MRNKGDFSVLYLFLLPLSPVPSVMWKGGLEKLVFTCLRQPSPHRSLLNHSSSGLCSLSLSHTRKRWYPPSQVTPRMGLSPGNSCGPPAENWICTKAPGSLEDGQYFFPAFHLSLHSCFIGPILYFP